MKATVNYKDEMVYIGIDVHKKTFTISAFFNGEIVKKATVPADGKKLSVSLKKWFVGAKICSVYEAGFSGFGLHRILEASGIKNIVIHAASVEVAANDRVKTDKRDSEKLAIQLGVGRFNGIYIPSEGEELRRQITRHREQLLKHRKRVGNQIKSRLHLFGFIQADDNRRVSKSFFAWVEGLKVGEELKLSLSMSIQHWKFINEQMEQLKIEFKSQSFEDLEIEEIYQSVPGIGDVIARTLANELGDLSKRFNSNKSLYKFLGFTPSEFSSGESVKKGRIDRQGSPTIRRLLVQAAWCAIHKDGVLMDSFKRISASSGSKKAIVAIARKLIGRARACIIDRTLYCTGVC